MMKTVAGTVLAGILGVLAYVYSFYFRKPRQLRRKMELQGVNGPLPSTNPLLGNIPEINRIRLLKANSKPRFSLHDHGATAGGRPDIDHDWPSFVLPHLRQWLKEYGSTFVYSTGTIHFLCTTDTEMVKEISHFKSLSLGRPTYLSRDFGPLFGQGIIASSGAIWAHQRKIIAPQFYADKVKSMVSLMVESTNSLIASWGAAIDRCDGGVADVNTDKDMRSLSADAISRACFGSNYKDGEHIFSKVRELQIVLARGHAGIPILRHLPTSKNREVWKLEKEINTMILDVVKQRAADSSPDSEKDLLQMILEGAKDASNNSTSANVVTSLDKFIVDNCKAIYFAGQDTTAISASWALMLLAAHPEWQSRARDEAMQLCTRDKVPDVRALQNMKIITMVIQETLRLYPPGVYVTREALEDIKFKHITIPKGMNVQVPISIVQQDPELWGPDAHLFNPERFAGGVLGATNTTAGGGQAAYIPFGVGSRVCVGQHFAMMELKVILSLLLLNFSFAISPSYVHSPGFALVVQPAHGVSLLIERATP
ncbi:unnamed protein product [Linum tenue]|uniref:Cytochrome P450 n=1 Tax=Linum tenue TaxID=586396 RepID=A0AAV0GW37_9ROSI|nr:unnamed protein product [Linum tenue]